MDMVLSAKNLNKTFSVGGQKVYALKDIELEIYAGEVCCITGSSGSGKSTLLGQLAGLDKPTSGSVVLCGNRLDHMNETQLAQVRLQNAGFVFQSYNLLPFLSAIENVAFPLMLKKQSYIRRMKRAKTELSKIGLGNRLMHRPHQMSGGQQQRVGIARAFVTNPKLIFADEPTGNLDSKTTEVVMAYMFEKARRSGTTLIMVTHEQRLAESADHIIEMKDGMIKTDWYRQTCRQQSYPSF